MTAEWRDRREPVLCDVVDALRAIDGGRPCPEHVLRNMREGWRAAAFRMLAPERESNAFTSNSTKVR